MAWDGSLALRLLVQRPFTTCEYIPPTSSTTDMDRHGWDVMSIPDPQMVETRGTTDRKQLVSRRGTRVTGMRHLWLCFRAGRCSMSHQLIVNGTGGRGRELGKCGGRPKDSGTPASRKLNDPSSYVKSVDGGMRPPSKHTPVTEFRAYARRDTLCRSQILPHPAASQLIPLSPRRSGDLEETEQKNHKKKRSGKGTGHIHGVR